MPSGLVLALLVSSPFSLSLSTPSGLRRFSKNRWTGARTLLDELVLDDSCEGELGFYQDVRDAVWRDNGRWESCIVRERDVEGDVRMAKKGKAPGLNQVRAEFIQEG
jgi:hypothetical protein